MDNSSASPGATNRHITHTTIAKYLALLGAILASFVISPLTANAVEFPPIPGIQFESNCGDGGIFTVVKLTNVGSGTATFHFVVTINGVVFEDDVLIPAGPDPAGPTYQFLDGEVVSVQITSTDGPGATASLSFDPVDCQPPPTASIAVVCSPVKGADPLVQYTYQNTGTTPVKFTFSAYGPDIDVTDANMASPAIVTQAIPDKSSVHATAFAEGLRLNPTLFSALPPEDRSERVVRRHPLREIPSALRAVKHLVLRVGSS